MQWWLKVSGTGEDPHLEGDWATRRRAWRRRHGDVSMFPRWPSIEPGDRLVGYAAGSYRAFGEARIFCVEEALAEPEGGMHERWPVQVRVRTLVAGPRLEFCPGLDEIGVSRRSVSQHSHIRLTPDQGELAQRLIAEAAQEHGGLDS